MKERKRRKKKKSVCGVLASKKEREGALRKMTRESETEMDKNCAFACKNEGVRERVCVC